MRKERIMVIRLLECQNMKREKDGKDKLMCVYIPPGVRQRGYTSYPTIHTETDISFFMTH